MKKAAIAALGLAVGFVVGYGTGRVSTGTPINPLSDQKGGGYQEGLDAAKQRATESGLLPPSPTETRQASGSIVSASADSFVLETSFSGPLDPLTTVRRTLRVTSSTKVLVRTARTPEERVAADIEFQKQLTSGNPVTPPEPFNYAPYASPLKTGDKVSVETEADLLKNETADALTVTIVSQP